MIEIHIDGNSEESLGSLWDGLSEHLIAKVYPVDHEGYRIPNTPEIHAPLLDGGALEINLNWHSPFESSGAESKAPMLAAMLQSGALSPVLNSLATNTGIDSDTSAKIQSSSDSIDEFRGRTGITRLNSTQIFSGMPPIKGSITLVFRAMRDPVREVERPFQQLVSWALPQEISDDGAIAGILKNVSAGKLTVKDTLKALLPSTAPQMIGIDYKGRTFAPMVIEAITEPLDSPIDSMGRYTRMIVPITVSSLTALDRDDWITVNASK